MNITAHRHSSQCESANTPRKSANYVFREVIARRAARIFGTWRSCFRRPSGGLQAREIKGEDGRRWGTNQELLTFLYVARGSAGEVRSMLSLLPENPSLSGSGIRTSRRDLSGGCLPHRELLKCRSAGCAWVRFLTLQRQLFKGLKNRRAGTRALR